MLPSFVLQRWRRSRTPAEGLRRASWSGRTSLLTEAGASGGEKTAQEDFRACICIPTRKDEPKEPRESETLPEHCTVFCGSIYFCAQALGCQSGVWFVFFPTSLK